MRSSIDATGPRSWDAYADEELTLRYPCRGIDAPIIRVSAAGSDSWIEAQQAISRLQAARGRTDEAAAELHQLRLARSGEPTSAADLAALDAAIQEVGALIERQQGQMDRVYRR